MGIRHIFVLSMALVSISSAGEARSKSQPNSPINPNPQQPQAKGFPNPGYYSDVFANPTLSMEAKKQILQPMINNPAHHSAEINAFLSLTKLTPENRAAFTEITAQIMANAEKQKGEYPLTDSGPSIYVNPREELLELTAFSLSTVEQTSADFKEKLDILDQHGLSEKLASGSERVIDSACIRELTVEDSKSLARFEKIYSRLPNGAGGTFCTNLDGSGTEYLGDRIAKKRELIAKNGGNALASSPDLAVKKKMIEIEEAIKNRMTLADIVAVFKPVEKKRYVIYTANRFFIVHLENTRSCTTKDAIERFREFEAKVSKTATECGAKNEVFPHRLLIPPKEIPVAGKSTSGVCNAWASVEPAGELMNSLLKASGIHKSKKSENPIYGFPVWQWNNDKLEPSKDPQTMLAEQTTPRVSTGKTGPITGVPSRPPIEAIP